MLGVHIVEHEQRIVVEDRIAAAATVAGFQQTAAVEESTLAENHL